MVGNSGNILGIDNYKFVNINYRLSIFAKEESTNSVPEIRKSYSISTCLYPMAEERIPTVYRLSLMLLQILYRQYTYFLEIEEMHIVYVARCE